MCGPSMSLAVRKGRAATLFTGPDIVILDDILKS